jgi:serine O-acetyltransferase
MSHADFIKQLHKKNTSSELLFPDKEFAHEFVEDLFDLLFIPRLAQSEKLTEYEKKFKGLKSHLSTLIYDITRDSDRAQTVTDNFFEALPGIYSVLLKDAAAIAKYDPAAQSMEEVLVAYPGFYTIVIYRLSHQLWQQDIRILPRLFTEYAHSKTGIDIHPGAVIGESFFIDHGTGIVIGETTIVGDNVRIYQGVTLGALSTTKEESAGSERRHPLVEDNVIIYPGATILGGAATIGKGSIIGSNVWITDSIPANSVVYQKNEVVSVRNFSFREITAISTKEKSSIKNQLAENK